MVMEVSVMAVAEKDGATGAGQVLTVPEKAVAVDSKVLALAMTWIW